MMANAQGYTNLQSRKLCNDFMHQGKHFCIWNGARVGNGNDVKGTLNHLTGVQPKHFLLTVNSLNAVTFQTRDVVVSHIPCKWNLSA